MLTKVKYVAEGEFFNWDIPSNISSEQWQQVLTNTPYEEMVKFFDNNPAIKHAIDSKCKPIDYFSLVQEVMNDACEEYKKQSSKG